MNTNFEVSNRAPARKGNRKLTARVLTQQDGRAKRQAPHKIKAEAELFAANLRREKALRVNALPIEEPLACTELAGGAKA